MIKETGVITGWVLVYNGSVLISKHYANSQNTNSHYSIEIFETEDDIDARIIELGLE